MSKKMEFEEEQDNQDWLVSYADMMTLIACFFILMMAFANFEPVGFQVKAEELSKHFRKDKWKSSTEQALFIEEEIARHPVLPKKAKISVKDDIMKVVFSGSTIFKNGEWKLQGETLKTVDSLVDILKTTNPHYRILVEGHADDNLPSNAKINTNWAISGLRAASVIERFEFYGFPRKNITAIAKGDTSPLVKSKDRTGVRVENLAMMNRRVIVKVLEPIKKKKVKLGLGVYFEDSVNDSKEGLEEVNEYKEQHDIE